jgi:hypothetical protein
MRSVIIACLFLLTGCGVKVDVDDVEVKHRLDVENIEKYARLICKEELPEGYSDAELQACLDLKIAQLYRMLADI